MRFKGGSPVDQFQTNDPVLEYGGVTENKNYYIFPYCDQTSPNDPLLDNWMENNENIQHTYKMSLYIWHF